MGEFAKDSIKVSYLRFSERMRCRLNLFFTAFDDG